MSQKLIPLARPDICSKDIYAVTRVLKSRKLSLGPELNLFEQEFASFCGTKYAIAVSSGTSALHLALRGFGISEGDEVITTPFSFIASGNCMLFERAVPRFVDVLQDTYCIDPAKVEKAITPKTKGILAVDVFGYLCPYAELRDIANRHNIFLLEDSCEALGSVSNGFRAGAFGDCGVFGFYPNKQITTGEGGMLVTNHERIATLARSMRNQGRNDDGSFLEHVRLGYNYRMSDIQCALGRSQLVRLPAFIKRRQEIFDWYAEEFFDFKDHVLIPAMQKNVTVSWFVYVIRLHDRYSRNDRDSLISFLKNEGIGCNAYFPSIHLQSFYRDTFGYERGAFPISESISDRTIALPFFTEISRVEVRRVCNTLREGVIKCFPK